MARHFLDLFGLGRVEALDLLDRAAALKDATLRGQRPPLPVGGAWWDSLADARSSVLLGTATPEQAVERAQNRVDPMMQTYAPFRLPKDYDKVRI